jgi:O-antigen/teichoic acid export membrane protein
MIKRIKNLIYQLLLKAQKFTGTDNIYLAKYGFYLTLGNFITMATTLLLSIAFARFLPKEIYGQYRYILSIAALLAITSLQGMNAAIVRGVARNFEGTVKQGFKTKLKYSLIGSLISLGLGIYFLIQGNFTFSLSFLMIALFLPLTENGEIYQSYLDGKKIFDQRVKYATISRVFSVITLIATLLLTKNLVILILIYFLSRAVFINYFFYRTLKKYPPNQNQDKQTISFGKHLSLVSIISIISQNLDKILLFHFLGPAKLAIYAFAVAPITQIRNPFKNIQALALPKFSTKPKEELKKTLPQKLIKAVILTIIIVVLYIIFAPLFYKILYPQYLESVFYSRLFSLTLLIFPISMIRVAFQSQMMLKEIYRLNILVPITKIILLITLTPFWGILGVILAELITQIIHAGLVLFFFKNIPKP